MDCLFCKIVNNKIPSYKIYEDDLFYAFLDIFPQNPGHSLLIPKSHTKDLLEVDSNVVARANDVIKKINQKFIKKLNSQGLTVISNNNLGQEVPHLHWHLIPRFKQENYTIAKSIKIDIKQIHQKLA